MKGKETKFCQFGKIKIKEDDKDFYVRGYVATTHPDRAAGNGFDGDILSKAAVQKVVDTINDTYNTDAQAVSERHDWIIEEDRDKPLAGVSVEPATLVELEDGNWGAHVGTVLSKTNPRYETVKANVEQGVYPGFSIEYSDPDFTPIVKEGKNYRYITDLKHNGFGYASRRKIANPHAEITGFGFKEIPTMDFKQKGDLTMQTKEEVKPEDKTKDPAATDPAKPGEETKPEDTKPEDTKETEAGKEPEAAKPEDVAAPEAEKKEVTVSAEDYAMLQTIKAKEKATASAIEVKEQVNVALKEILGKNAPFLNLDPKVEGKDPEKKEIQFKEMKNINDLQLKFKELDGILPNGTYVRDGLNGSIPMRQSMQRQIVDMQYKEADDFHMALKKQGQNIYRNSLFSDVSTSDVKMEMKGDVMLANPYASGRMAGTRIEYKSTKNIDWTNMQIKGQDNATTVGLQTDSNVAHASWTYGSMYQSPVEFNDIYGQAIINQLNDQTTTWGKLKKEDWSGRSQIQFRARTGRNSTAGGYTEGTVWAFGTDFDGVVGRDKFQQPFSYYNVLVAVTGQELQLSKAPGGVGDIWGNEVSNSTKDLLVVLNKALIGAGVGTSENISLGFEGLILGTTGTLYARNIATYTTLKSHKETVSARVSIDLIRKMKRYCEAGDTSTITNSNANANDLVFFCNHLQRDRVYALIQDMQRTVPTSARAGFEGVLEFDGVPFFADKDIDTDDLFLIDTAHTKIAINLPPTMEALPVTSDAKAAHIKIYWNLYSDAPSNNYWANTLTT